MNTIRFANRNDFRAWLSEHALYDDGIWLVFDKRKNADAIKSSEALEEALCFGWIDGQLFSIDENTYRKYFKQRGKNSVWSEKNKKLAEKLEADGLMTDFGRIKIELARQSGQWDAKRERGNLSEEQIRGFEDLLRPHETAYANFTKMPASSRRSYMTSYFFGTKTDAGKANRFLTIVERLNHNLNPMESLAKHLERVKGQDV
jgi:uncharacterized protein YdeI (YjbR/CyaY-like superfamily)